MKRLAAVTLTVAVFLALLAETHKSVREMKPPTEAEREAHHLHHRNARPEKQHSIHAQQQEHGLPKSKSYHFQWGPEYPDHRAREDYHKPPRYHSDGGVVDERISDKNFRQHFLH